MSNSTLQGAAASASDAAKTPGVLWSAWPEDDCDSDPRIDPMAQKVTEWFVGRWPAGADEPECRILIGQGRSAEIVARRIAEKLTSILNTDAIKAAALAPPAVPESVRRLSEAATGGEWYTESEKCDGSYGAGEDGHEGYLAYSIVTDAERPHGSPGVIAETSNSTLGIIHEEWNEDDFTAWDDVAKNNTAFIVAAVNFVRTLLAPAPSPDGPEVSAPPVDEWGKPFGAGPGWTAPHDGPVSPEIEAACRRIAARRAGGAYADAANVSEAAWRSEIHAAEAALLGVSAPPGGGGVVAIYSEAENEESYKIGHRDGYEEGVQDAAMRVGLDGEYRCSSEPDRHVPDAPTMLDRIAEHVEAIAAAPATPETAAGVGRKAPRTGYYEHHEPARFGTHACTTVYLPGESAAGGEREIVRHIPDDLRGLSGAATQGHWHGPAFSTDIRAVGALGPPIGMTSLAGDGNGLNDRAFILALVNWFRFILSAPAGAQTAGGDGWQDISTAPKKSRPSIVIETEVQRLSDLVTKSEFIAHWAEDLSGEEQPPFRGWFYDNGYGFVQLPGTPKRWRPLPAPPSSTATAHDAPEGGR